MSASPEQIREMSDTNETPDRPANVITAIAAVMRDLPAIGKDSEVTGDGPRYKFRGIEAITAAAQKLMGEHGVVFVPRVVGMERRDISVGSKGAVWDEYTVTVEYDVYGPAGVSDVLPMPVRVLQLGRDNSDKGMAKAMTMAYKTALNQVFCIGDSKNDADNERHENAEGGKSDWYSENGWKDQAEHDATRGELLHVLSESASTVQSGFKERRLAAKIDLRQALTRTEYDTLTSFLSELGVELPAVGQRDASQPNEGEPAAQDAPSAPSAPESAPVASDEDVAQAAGEDAVEAEIARVKALKPAEVTAELESRGLDVAGNTEAQRKRLVLAVLRDKVAAVPASS